MTSLNIELRIHERRRPTALRSARRLEGTAVMTLFHPEVVLCSALRVNCASPARRLQCGSHEDSSWRRRRDVYLAGRCQVFSSGSGSLSFKRERLLTRSSLWQERHCSGQNLTPAAGSYS